MRVRRTAPTELDFLVNGNGFRFDEKGELVMADESGETHSQAVAKYAEKMNRLNAIAGVYQRADRIITGDEITVKVIDDRELTTNARSNGRDIELNANLIPDLTDESILALHGTNYHELAHAIFSPRIGSNLGIWVRENKMFSALKILEEARSEQLMTQRYPSIRPYLEANIYMNMLGDKAVKDWGGYFYLITGRTYLPLELRQSILDMALEQFPRDIVLKVHGLVHDYRSLSFPRDFDKAKTLISELAGIIGLDDKPTGVFPNVPEGDCEMPSNGRPATKSQQDSLQENAPDSELESMDSDGNSDKREPSKSEGSESKPTQTAGVEDDKESSDGDIATAKVLSELINDIKNNSVVRRELNDTRRAIIDSDVAKSSIVKGYHNEIAPSGSAIVTSNRFSAELERLVRDSDPAWRTHTPRGRLNVARTMNPDVNKINEMFDEWDIGSEATDIEAVILTDNSGSMGGNMKTVCEATWIIKRGIESINGSVSAYNFESDTELLYSNLDKAKPRSLRYVSSRGGTNPLRGLIEADRTLTASKKPIKILFMVTDGEWDKSNECNSLIKSMNDKGVITCVVFIGNLEYYRSLLKDSLKATDSDSKEYYRQKLDGIHHNAKVFHAIADTKEVIKVATALVKSTIGRR